jgi:hypothetical protein
VFHLRNLKFGWTIAQRERYFSWFKWAQERGKPEVTYPQGSAYTVWEDQAKAGERHPKELIQWFKDVDRDYGDGASYGKQLELMRKEAVANLCGNGISLCQLGWHDGYWFYQSSSVCRIIHSSGNV